MITFNDAILALSAIHHPETGIHISGKSETNLLGVTLTDNSPLAFTFDDVLVKKSELEAAEPLRLLRLERTRLLAQSDWMANSDVTMTEEWRVYRQALRDITTQTPSLDSDGNLTGITWPTPPTE